MKVMNDTIGHFRRLLFQFDGLYLLYNIVAYLKNKQTPVCY